MTQPMSASQALAIVDNCPFPLLVLDASSRVSHYNRALERLLERLRSCGTRGTAATPLGDDPLATLADARETVSWTEPSGEQFHFEIAGFSLPGPGKGQVRIFVDISRQVRLEQAQHSLNEELRQHTLTDPVTGLLNQRGLMLALEPQVARSRRYNSPMSVIILAIDEAARGHARLVEVGRLLKDQLRWADLIGCTEQQEFMLVLPETSAEAAAEVAEKLERRLIALAPQAEGAWFCVGISGWRRNDNARSLLKRAAQSLAQVRAQRTVQFIAS